MATRMQTITLWQAPPLVARPRQRLLDVTDHSGAGWLQIRRAWVLSDFTDVRWADHPFPCELCGRVGVGALRYRWVHRHHPEQTIWVDRTCALRYFLFPHTSTHQSREAALDRFVRQHQQRRLIAHWAEACLQETLTPVEQRQWQRAVGRRFHVRVPIDPTRLDAIWPALIAWCGLTPDPDAPLTVDEIARIRTALQTPVPRDASMRMAAWSYA